MIKIATGEKSKNTKEFFDFLKENELVYFEGAKKENKTISPLTTTSDLDVNNPFMSYDSVNQRYDLWGGFRYNNDYAWIQDGYEGSNRNIGGEDALGISLDSGTNSTGIADSYLQGQWHIQPGTSCNTGYYNGSDSFKTTARDGSIDYSQGAIFRGQDANVVLSGSGCTAQHNRFGSGAVKISYYSGFANANGYMKTKFSHNWNSVGIQSISFSYPLGITVSATSTSNNTGTLASPADIAY